MIHMAPMIDQFPYARSDLENELAMNYVSTLHITKGMLAHFKHHPERKSALITVTSGLAAVPSPSVANYSATSENIYSSRTVCSADDIVYP